MAGHALRLSRRLSTQSFRPCKSSCLNFQYRTLTSATPRSSSSPTTRLPRPTGMGTAAGNATVPELVLGAGGKAPGFVQQMLFSAPVQEKNAKGMAGRKKKQDRRRCSRLLTRV